MYRIHRTHREIIRNSGNHPKMTDQYGKRQKIPDNIKAVFSLYYLSRRFPYP